MKDPTAAHPIAAAWRPMLRQVVQRFADGDYSLDRGVAGVEPVSASTAEQIREFLVDYGATLVELPQEAWETSLAQWMGTYWQIIVDLWTAEEGRSDLILEGEVIETRSGPQLRVRAVYVP